MLVSFQVLAADIEVTVSPTTADYENGQTIDYLITIKNTTAKTFNNVEVSDPVWDTTTSGESGQVKAFSGLNISPSNSWGSNPGSFSSSDSNLDVKNGRLFAYGKLEYLVQAQVSDEATGVLELGETLVKADIDGDGSLEQFAPSSKSTLNPVPYEYTVSVSVDQSEYAVGTSLTYTVEVVNTGSYKVQGLKLDQPFASLEVESTAGSLISPFSSVDISAEKRGSGSDVGDFSKSGDLSVENASIAVGGKLIYTITTVVSEQAVGDIITSAVAHTKDGDVNSVELTTPPAQPVLDIEHSISSSNPYLVSSQRTFNVEVSNSGSGIAHSYHVKQNISQLLSNLGLGNDLKPAHNSTDVTGNPFGSWTIEVTDLGAKSLSKFNDAGPQSDIVFDDEISLFPGETISYEIKATISPVAIGTVQGANAGVFDTAGGLIKDAQISGSFEAERTLNVGDSEIQIEKTTKESQYIPGNTVEYEIKVSNTSSKYFANNLQVVDDLTCVQTEQAGGAGQGQAFKRWKLEPSSAEDSLGTDHGQYSYGSWSTSAVTVSPDIAPGKSVTYKLTAEVNDSSVGLILDDNPACSDNVTEEGSGVQMPEDNLRASKDVDSRYYSSGDVLTYTIRVDNDGDGFANQVQVIDDLTLVETTDIYGNVIKAFDSWSITAEAFHQDGSAATATDTGITGSLDSPAILDVEATIEPHSYVIYTIAAKTKPHANGHIQNSVTVDGSVYADRGSDPRDFTIQVNKTAKVGTSGGFVDEDASYSKLDNQVTYQIHLKNAKSNGYATNVKVTDPISSITAGLLEPDSASKKVFSSWTISSEIRSDNPLLDGNGTYTDVGLYEDNKDIDLTAQIAPNVEVIYTITAQIDRSVSNEIIYKRFDNTVSVETPDSDSQSGASDTVRVHPKAPNVVVVKTSKENEFVPGQWVEFDVTVYNRGAGYANEVRVTDDIAGMNAFSEWTIKSSTDSNNTTYKTGSYADKKENYPDNGNINTRIDIDPQTSDGMGSVTYTIRGLVRNDYAEEEISNTVEIHDPINNLDQSATAEIGDGGDSKLNVSILKTADKSRFVPGEEVTYFITLQNNSENDATNLKLVDPLTEIRSVLANEKNNQYADFQEQSPFEYWEFDYADGAGWQGQTTKDLIYPEGADNTSFTLDAGQTRTFKIKAKIKDNVIGSNLSGGFKRVIANDAYIFRDYKLVTEQSHVSHHEMERVDSGGDVTRTLLVNGVPNRFYAPGDKLTYQIKVSSQRGYFNNHRVFEDIKGVEVLLLDGTQANPFNDKFSVAVEKEDSNGGDGTTDGTLDGVVEDDKNIDTMIDVAGEDHVLYTVEGIVRGDATGDITIGGITVEPYDYHLVFKKTVDQKNYQPNEPLTYHLTVTNDGKGNAYDIPIEDSLSIIEIDLIDGTKGPAFPIGWTIEPTVTGGNPHAEVDLDGTIKDNEDIKTHISVPAGETIDYKVTATVNEKAVGDIVNLLKVDGDTVSAESKADTEKYAFSKHVIKYLDQDGTTELSSGYTPGGYIVYEILLENKNNVHLKNVPIVDDIKGITTDYFDGTTGQAFDSWTIKSDVDSSGLSNGGTFADNSSIDTDFDLAGNSFADGGTFVKYTITAKVSEKAVGPIRNSARVDGKHTLDSERSDMLAVDLKKTHKAFTDNTFATQKTTYNFDPSTEGQRVVYHLRLENKGKGTEYAASLKEEFSKIKSRLAQEAASEANDQTGPVFEEFGWNVTVTQSPELVTSVGSFVGGSNIDIDIPVLSIAAGGWIDFVIETKIRHDALENVIAKPFYNGSVFQKSTIKPETQDLKVAKRIISIGGRPYSSGDTYKPGEEVIYQLDVNNNAKVWTDQTRIRDIVSDIHVEVLGGAEEQAFSVFSIADTISQGLNSSVDTYLETYDASSDLDVLTDIAPKEEIQFTIKGTIRDDALGDIDANKASAGGKNVNTPEIPPVAPNLVFEKLVTNTTADSNTCSFPSNTGAGCEYNPSGQVNYTITIENTGEGIANDIPVVDKLNSIVTSTGVKAFSSVSTTVLEQPPAERFDISGSYQGAKPLDAKIDLMPGDKVVFGLSGTVDGDATGTITNIAKVDNVDSNDVVLGQGDAEILASKTTDTPTYVPGGEVRYTMYIANKSDSNADVTVLDEISKFMVETADGSMQTALQSWTTTAQFVGNIGATHNDASAIQSSGDINALVKLGAAATEPTVLKIDVVGKVRDDAVGKFGNTLYVDRKQFDLKEHFIYPEQGELTVTKDASISPALYAPGDSIGFDIVVENTGVGYVQNVEIRDLVKSLKADVVNSFLPGQVFEKWDASKSSISIVDSGSSNSFTVSQTDFDSAESFKGVYNLAPGSQIQLHLEGTVNSNIIGEITNTVVVTADNMSDQTDSATYLPIDAEVLVSKTVDKDVYAARDELTYTIVLTNTQRVWATDVKVQDFVDRISAESIYGSTISVFEPGSITISATSDKGTTTLPSLSGDYIDNTIDIAPEDIVTVTIKGTLKPEIIGDVVNTVSIDYDDKSISDDAVSVPLVPSLKVTKTPIEEFYTPGSINGFEIAIENQDVAFANDIKLQDLISTIRVDTVDGADNPAFSRWTYSYKANDPMTSVDSSTMSWNTDINNTIDLAPNDTIVFTIQGEVDERAISDINNTAKVEFDGKDLEVSAVIKPKPAEVTVTKTADREFYQAGETAQFVVTVSNEGEGFANDVTIKDIMSDVKVTLVDGTEGTAFEAWSIKTELSDISSTLSVTPSGKNPDIDTVADIAPLSTVTFTIDGIVNRYATTDIVNVATVDFDSQPQKVVQAVIKHRPVSLKLEKFVGESGTDTEMTYEPGKDATFRVVLSNLNEGFVAGIELKDLLNSMDVETVNGVREPAFESWTIKVNKGNELTTISPDPSGANREVDSVVNLAPNDVLELVITGKVNSYAIGQIDNKATMSVNLGRPQRMTAVASLLPEPDNVIITEEADNPIYKAGQPATFRVTLHNDSKGFANDVVINSVISRMKVQTKPDLSTGDREVVDAFTDWVIEAKSQDPRSNINVGSLSANNDINIAGDIAPGDIVEIAITGTTDPRAMGEIIHTTHKIDESANVASGSRDSRNASIETVSAMITPEAVSFAIDKTTTKGENAEYTNDDQELTYLLKVSNEGSATITGVEMVDEISKLVGANGNSLFTSWKVNIEEWPTGQVKAEFTDKDLLLPDGGLSLDLLPYMGNGYEITITGQLNKGLDDNITNTFTVTDPATGTTASDDVTIHVKKFADNEGDLLVTKEALKTDAQVGDVIEYEVTIYNNNESEFKNVKLVDRYPSGFAYVEGSTELVNSGPDGEFDTGDDVIKVDDPAVTSTLTFNVGDMLAYGGSEQTITEKVRIRYLLRVTVGATFGKYVNSAVAMSPPEGQTAGALQEKSNTATATVEVLPDKVFDTASIIGKVFEDHNGDGFQADATAFDIEIIANVPNRDYIADSTVIIRDGKEVRLKDIKHIEEKVEESANTHNYSHDRRSNQLKKVQPVDSVLVKGYEIDELFGLSHNRTLPSSNKVIFQFETRTDKAFNFSVVTQSGTRLNFDRQGNIETHYVGDKKDELSAENLDVTRNLYRDGDHYLWEIIIENKGIYEDGLPGVRLLTVEGIVIETDQYGRYHVPDQWVLDKKGKNFLVKVDTDSLPTGMKVISENPRVQRISPNKLTKFNFSVAVDGE
ncbi:DUF11 domain-containing protein [Vibrio aquaticus]|uniref:DUF11 domain-containing protein n=1 Tax=Vibrio aquaticus TaxID=2496559 RepID=A0A3S0MLF9_9VIBR|nr:DUF11 domain-containing protein [Vibrio aquaticus]RTZ17222.1 DUF11 domain-containing protein [Vibrio aquaticus]